MDNVKQLFVSPTDSIRDLLVCIDRAAKGIALVVDEEGHLMATVTDGDVRRAILAGMDLDQPVSGLLARTDQRVRSDHPVTAPNGTPDEALLHLMNEKTLRQIPLVDDERRVVGIAFLVDLAKEYESPLRAVVMAGGFGTRLRPLTEQIPKPMLPVGDQPLLEIIVKGLRDAGIRQVNVTTHYKAELITDHFKNGEDFGVDIRYVNEDQPLGTAGALSLLEESDEPLLVINGDILTRVDFKAMLNFHRECNADLTVGVRQYEFRVPYGVIETEGVSVKAISEKPVLRQFINAGIYLLDPGVRCFIPKGKHYDVPDLIDRLLQENRPVVCFPIREYWLDIGKSEHYDQARMDIATGRF
jgi:dTDP-glucose pyrophosphorylase/CBS domain-containing protein